MDLLGKHGLVRTVSHARINLLRTLIRLALCEYFPHAGGRGSASVHCGPRTSWSKYADTKLREHTNPSDGNIVLCLQVPG